MKKLMTVLMVLVFAASFSVMAGEKKVKKCDGDPVDCKKKIHQKMKDKGMIGVEGDWNEEKAGLVIKEFYEESNAPKAGVKAGDMLVKINGIGMNDKEGIKKDMDNRVPGKTVTLMVIRDDKKMKFDVELVAPSKKTVKKAILDHWEKYHPEFSKERMKKVKMKKEMKKKQKAETKE